MKTLVLGLGNPVCSDDGVGFHIARALENRVNPQEVTVTQDSVAGLDFLDLLIGYKQAIIIDAIQTKEGKAGQVYHLEPGAFNATQHTITPHDVTFFTALELGRRLGLSLPEEIHIYAIEVEDISTFSEECTDRVRKVIPLVVDMILGELGLSS